MVTYDEVVRRFEYDPITGIFTHKLNKGNARKGDVVGTLLSCGYLRTMIDGKSYWLHKLAFVFVTKAYPQFEIDHINRVRTDNRFVNLRQATRSQNCGNSGVRRHNTSGFKGVFKHQKGWMVCIAGKYVGMRHTPEDAAALYDDAAIKHYGEFALTNRMMGLI